jgi:hypothetical protein
MENCEINKKKKQTPYQENIKINFQKQKSLKPNLSHK